MPTKPPYCVSLLTFGSGMLFKPSMQVANRICAMQGDTAHNITVPIKLF